MFRGLQQQSKWVYLSRWSLIFLTMAGLFACGPAPAEQSYPPCEPNSSTANIYINPTPHPLVSLVHQSASTDGATLGIPVTGQGDPWLWARYTAFQFLTSEAKRWTSTKTIPLDNASTATIRITFIHPDMMQAVFLNEKLRRSALSSDFQQQVNDAIGKVSLRSELLFLINVSFDNNGQNTPPTHVLDINIASLKLINTDNLSITPLHDDHNLDEPILSTQGSVFGFVGYPIGIQVNSGCAWVLNPQFNTNIVIVMKALTIDSSVQKNLTWTIPYMPMLDTGGEINLNELNGSLQNFDSALLSPSFVPPVRQAGLGGDDESFWREYARFMWGCLTAGGR